MEKKSFAGLWDSVSKAETVFADLGKNLNSLVFELGTTAAP